MSTIAAGTTTGTALVSTGNTDGTLQLQVNGTTPSVTLATTGAIGVGSSPSYGTSGQVLVSGGSSAAPTWTTPSAGALVYISTQTVSGTPAAVDFTSGFSSTYDDYIIMFEGVAPDLIDSFALRVFRDGSVDSGGNYWYQNIRGITTTVSASYQSGYTGSTDTKWTMTGQACAPGNVTFGKLEIYNVNSTNPSYTVNMATLNNLSTQSILQACSSAFNSGSGTFSGLRFYWSAGNNFTAGTFRLYGVAKS